MGVKAKDISEGFEYSKKMPYEGISNIDREFWRCGYNYALSDSDHAVGTLTFRVLKRVALDGFEDRVIYIPVYENPESEASRGAIKMVTVSTFVKKCTPHPKAYLVNPLV